MKVTQKLGAFATATTAVLGLPEHLPKTLHLDGRSCTRWAK